MEKMQEDIRDVCRRFRKNQTKAEKAFWKIVALVTFVRFTLTNKKEYVVSLRKANIISLRYFYIFLAKAGISDSSC